MVLIKVQLNNEYQLRKVKGDNMIRDLRSATKIELLEEWHKTRKDLSRILDTIDTIEKFNTLKNCYLLPIYRYMQTLEKMINKKVIA